VAKGVAKVSEAVARATAEEKRPVDAIAAEESDMGDKGSEQAAGPPQDLATEKNRAQGGEKKEGEGLRGEFPAADAAVMGDDRDAGQPPDGILLEGPVIVQAETEETLGRTEGRQGDEIAAVMIPTEAHQLADRLGPEKGGQAGWDRESGDGGAMEPPASANPPQPSEEGDCRQGSEGEFQH
jgi:hypothetical protein